MTFLSGQDDFFQTANQPISVRHLSQLYNKSIYKPFSQIFIFVVVAGLLGVNIYGTTQLKQQFENKWFLPTGTVVRSYMDINDEVFQS